MIIVTGAAGFIGSATIWGLNRRGQGDILAVDQLETSDKWKNMRGLSFVDYLEKQDFRQMINSDKFADSATAIIHMGACSSTMETDASYLIDNNYRYTQDLAEFAIRNNIRFIYASSAATYGDGSQGYADDHKGITKLAPMNMYGFSKQLFDQWALTHHYLKSIVGLKFSNVFGPNEYHKEEMRSVPNKAYKQIKESGVVKLFKSYKDEYGDGQQQRDFIYVKDVVEMILFFLDHPECNGIFNAGAAKARSWNELVRACFAALDVPCQIDYIDMPDEIRNKYQYFTELNMAKLERSGFSQSGYSLEDGIRDYYQNYLEEDAHLS